MPFQKKYDPGFLNVSGFGQNIQNPLKPVFYQALGVVEDLSVYQSIFASATINAGQSFNVGTSSLSTSGMSIGVPSNFQSDVELDQNIRVNQITDTERIIVAGKEYVETVIVAKNGTFVVLAAI